MRTGEIISRIGDAVKIRVFVNEVSINLYSEYFHSDCFIYTDVYFFLEACSYNAACDSILCH